VWQEYKHVRQKCMYVSQLEKEEEIEPLYKDEESIEIKIEKMK